MTYVVHQRGQVGRIQDGSLVGFLEARHQIIEHGECEEQKKSVVGSGRGGDHEPISTLGENGLEGVCAGALDHADERPGIEYDLFTCVVGCNV